MNVNKFISMVNTMLKIGCIGFGGGTALIPVIEDEIVEKSHIVTEDEFNSDVMIASITPGALPVEIAAGIGHAAAGKRGMIAGASAMAFPGAFLTLLLLALVSSAGSVVKTQIAFLAVGVSAFIILTLFQYAAGTLRGSKDREERYLYLFIMAAVSFLSGEANLYQLFGISATPIFALSTVKVLAAAFFIILFTGGKLRDARRSVPALVIAAGYFLCVGKAHLIPEKFKPVFFFVMAILSVAGTVQSVQESRHKRDFPLSELSRSLLSWCGFVLIFSLPALYLWKDTLRFIGEGFLSSIMSFGGGDAYLSVAQGLFVDGGVVSYWDFYGNIVSVANALPGSILCKILTGVGYMAGYHWNESVPEGIAMAACAFACSVAASGMIFELVRAIYDKYENLLIFDVVKHFIRPIISGLLINVALSLYITGILSQASANMPAVLLFGVTAVIMLLNYWSDKKKHLHLVWRILLSAAVSFAACNLCGAL